MPHIISTPMTQQQFDKAQIALDAAPGVSHTGGQRSGSVKSPQLDFDYTFDGTSFAMDITGRHGFEAKVAPDSKILERVEEMLA